MAKKKQSKREGYTTISIDQDNRDKLLDVKLKISAEKHKDLNTNDALTEVLRIYTKYEND